MAHAIDQRYAQALADLVAKGAIPADLARRELAELATLVSESVPLRAVIASPAVSWEKKLALLDAIAAKAGVSRVSRNFMIVTAQRGRFGHLGAMEQAFEEIMLQQQGVVRAEVTSARTLGEAERAGIERELEARLGRKLQTRYQTDSELVGGFIARVGDQVYDGSIRGRLQRLRQALIA